MNRLVWMGSISYLIIGMAHVVVGSILEQTLHYYGLDYAQGGQWIMNQFLGFLVGVLAGPYLTRWLGRRSVILTALGSLTIAETAYAFLLPWGWMLTAAPVAGFGFGLTETILASTVIEYVERNTWAMARMEAFFGIGALVMPVIASLFIGLHHWRWVFPILAVVSCLSTLVWWRMSFGSYDRHLIRRVPANRESGRTPDSLPAEGTSSAHSDGKPKEAAHLPRTRYGARDMAMLGLGIAFFLVYVGMEMSFSNYLPSILIGKTGMRSAIASLAISLFWGFMVVGRMAVGRVADWSGYTRYLFLSIIGGLVFIGLVAMSGSTAWSLIFTSLDGLMWSGVFAIMLLYLNRCLPGMTERTTSLMVACGGIGGAVFPKVTGVVMDRFNPAAALWMLTAMAVILLTLMTGMFFYDRLRLSGVGTGHAGSAEAKPFPPTA